MRIRLTALLMILAVPPAPAAVVAVRAVDSQGAPVPGALVGAGGAAPRRTDESGTVRLEVSFPVTVHAAAPGFGVTARNLAADPGREVTLELRPEAVYSTVNVAVRREDVEAGQVVAGSLEIEQTGARTVFDAVDRLVPSAFVTRRGVMGYGIAANGTGQVSIRGVGNSPNTAVLVVIDGRPDFMGMMGHPLPDFYSLPDAAAVSVTKGPASVLYGSNAMGGAINIQPAEPVEGVHTELSGSLGNYWTGQYRMKHGAGFRRWFYHATAGADHTNGHRPVSHFRNQDGTLAVGYSIRDAWKTALRGRYGHFVVEDPGPLGRPPGDWASVGRGGLSWNLDNNLNRVWGNTRLFGSWGHHHISDGWRSNDRTLGARVHQNLLLHPTLLVDGGGDLADFGGQGRNVRSRTDFGVHHGTAAAGFGRIRWTPGTRLAFNAGFRGEHNSIFGAVAVPEFGASAAVADGLTLSVAAARGYRNPTIRELYLFPAPNPNLEPERMWNYQASVLLRPTRDLAASLTAYYADLDNLIVLLGRFPNFALKNTGRALNRGLEADARWRAARWFSLSGGYAYLRSTNLAPYLPSHKLTFGAELSFSRLFVYVGGVSVGERWTSPQKTATLGAYTLPAAKVMYKVNQRLTVFGAVDNFADADYQVITGYPMPGANATGGFAVRF